MEEVVYLEKQRLRRMKKYNLSYFFTYHRIRRDRKFWTHFQEMLLRVRIQEDREKLLESLLWYYVNEIGGHFNKGVYWFAARIVPWGFRWLLNAASVRHFLPWGMTESLQSRLRIVGEVSQIQKLAKQGTILLVPTHQSNIDSVLIGYVIYLMSLPPFAYGAGLNLFTNPILNFLMSHLGAYTVDRQKNNVFYKAALKNYSAMILHEGVHSIFFPGGGRSRSGAIEDQLKLGLLGTALQAQVRNFQTQKEKPNIYIVPMVTSYHFVLEAASLIEQYLEQAGRHRFIAGLGEEPWEFSKLIHYFWKFFSMQSGITVRIGQALDVFGNPVDMDGRSLGPNGTFIDPRRWLTTCGELRAEPKRDEEYICQLGNKLTVCFHREYTVLTSHLVAFSFFQALLKKYSGLDVYRFLRLTLAQRTLPYEKFFEEAEACYLQVVRAAESGKLYLCEELKNPNTEKWIQDGLKQLGTLHQSSVLTAMNGIIWTEDMNLLYYYRNRLTGFGLSQPFMEYDEKGFLE